MHVIGITTFSDSYITDAKVMATGRDLIDRACAICFASKDFRVLPCGHPICFGCLENLHTGGNGIVTCPWDREEDAIEPSALPTPKEFTGKIFYDSTDQIDDFVRLLKSLLKQRKVTIQHLRTVAEILASYERKCAVSKITGSAAGVSSNLHDQFIFILLIFYVLDISIFCFKMLV